MNVNLMIRVLIGSDLADAGAIARDLATGAIGPNEYYELLDYLGLALAGDELYLLPDEPIGTGPNHKGD